MYYLPCHLQCLTKEITRLYMDKELYQFRSVMGTHCLNATNIPCLVPQAKDIVNISVQRNLKMCPTVWDYYCELVILHHAGQMASTKCHKPCQTSKYRLTLDREASLTMDQGLGETIVTFWFSSNTIMKYKEVEVV